MEKWLVKYPSLGEKLRRQLLGNVSVNINQFFDNVISYLQNLTFSNNKYIGLDILATICEDLTPVHYQRLLYHPALVNHTIFVYIGHTLEMLLVKSNYIRSIPMNKHEEDCFYSVSYFVTQLCLHHNDNLTTFYGKISDEIFPVTDKINIRDKTIDQNSRKSNTLSAKPNQKVTCLSPTTNDVPVSEEKSCSIVDIPRKRIFLDQLNMFSVKTDVVKSKTLPDLPTDLPSKRYQDVFFTTAFFSKFIRTVHDLSEHEYYPYHVKYKVIDRFVRLFSKLNIVDQLFDLIVKCLCSKFYQQAFLTIEPEQLRLNPKQLFYIEQCTEFIVLHQFQQQDKIPNLLCQIMINSTKPIIEQTLPITNTELDSTYFNQRDIALYALSCHLKMLTYLSLTQPGRRFFQQTSIIDEMINILQHDALISNACQHEELFHNDIAVIVYTFMLLCNLAYDKGMFSILKHRDFRNIYSKLESSKDRSIKFVCSTLSTILSHDQVYEENEPMKLKQAFIDYCNKPITETQYKKISDVAAPIRDRDEKTKLTTLSEAYIATLCRDIEGLCRADRSDEASNSLKYKDVGRRIRVAAKQETKEVDSILDSILKCLDSNFYLKVFEKIELSGGKVAARGLPSDRYLAKKHLFFMRECPEFLFRHDYKRRKDIAKTLGRKMLEHTKTIFSQHLPVLIGEEGKRNPDEMSSARMAALSYHLKVLNHFTLIRMIRNEIMSLRIIEQILIILQEQSVIGRDNSVHEAKIEVIEQCLVLLYSLGQEKETISMLKSKNVVHICMKLGMVTAKTIRFLSQIVLVMMNKNAYNDLYEPHLLPKICIDYIDKALRETRKSYQGIKLHRLLKTLTIMVKNDAFTEGFLGEKNGVFVFVKCVCMKYSEEEDLDQDNQELMTRIQNSALSIIWALSCYGPKSISKLKSNNLFIDRILSLSKGASDLVNRLIWRLGSEDRIRFEKTQKRRDQQQSQGITTEDEQLIAAEDWDENIPYDLLISYSHNIQDHLQATKIYNYLIAKGYKVYNEKPGQHRLELMQKAIDAKKPILICLSSTYRTSKYCMAELEYANKQSTAIIPVIIEAKFSMQGWLKHLISKATPINIASKKSKDDFLKITEQIENITNVD